MGLSIQLPDGRRLGYAEYGMRSGRPVLFFHGSPGSSHIHADMAEIAKLREVRLIPVERPGYGLSAPQPGRSILNWADDIATLTDVLGISQFAIIGFSGGSSYPLACAYKYPHRVTKAVLAGTLAPLDAPDMNACLPPVIRDLFALARSSPEELRKTFAAIAPSADSLLNTVSALAGDWDKKILAARAQDFEADYAKALLVGVEGVASDYELASADWGFPLGEIRSEVHLWSGTSDQNTPPAMTNYLASQLSNCRTHILQGEGHYALYEHWDDILGSAT